MTNGAVGTQNVYHGEQHKLQEVLLQLDFRQRAEPFGGEYWERIPTPTRLHQHDRSSRQSGRRPELQRLSSTRPQCMGWNANTNTLTTPSVISDLVPTASGTSGKGYQKPSTTCAANADYPTWLKGIVYLQWNGSSLTENGDLVTKPCNM